MRWNRSSALFACVAVTLAPLCLGSAAAVGFAAIACSAAPAGSEASAAVKPSKLRRLSDNAMVAGRLDKAIELLTQACSAERHHQNHYKRFRILLRKKKVRSDAARRASALVFGGGSRLLFRRCSPHDCATVN